MRTKAGDVTFVHWTVEGRMQGRRARLDDKGKVVTIIAYAVPTEDFADAELLVTATGIPMVRRPKQFRLLMPLWCRLLAWRGHVVHFGGPMDLSSTPCLPDEFKGCAVCQAHVACGADLPARVTNPDVLVCKTCLRPWHVQCAKARLSTGRSRVSADCSWECGVCNCA